ncbi:helix-turn-helix transcriptional regulator [Microbispora bryophytorum]|uniref:WYL domain-containing protein n=1 Tax=Microbispora bryophytorum TaxID=1460882 RepID=A0A8H9L9N9_9ACTN|nr:WYL domain-containing protein [Microbispora bryophytorum]GGO07993.1 hypothetical protein GCM10011574_22160 [Microbispora bryophytorum]
MPARLRRRIDTLQVTTVEGLATRPDVRVDGGVLVALSAAVHAGEVLRFDYAAASPQEADDDGVLTPPRRVEPHHLVTWGGRWHVVAWDLDREDWRTFRADRITPRSPTGPRFPRREAPGGDVAVVVGRFDAGIEVVGPAELREAFAQLARRYARAASGAMGGVGRAEPMLRSP